ncbi:hypothetical protein [Shewanella aestuarii]|uniref:Uncharacterized protein n=1 Tax=Shewanella aestuarii TaxID=1028752 RepID=A0A6G9QR55_9GAMM|nr:hypothetical protein [Shewanella aestuarii]QIR16583.1 hypothetical protein HBH39_19095 [Shewanella aestuarii]
MRNLQNSILEDIANIPENELREIIHSFKNSLEDLKHNERFNDDDGEDIEALEDALRFPMGFPKGIDFIAYVPKPAASDIAGMKKQTGLKTLKKFGIIKELVKRTKLDVSLTEKQQGWFFLHADHRSRQIMSERNEKCFEWNLLQDYFKSRFNFKSIKTYCFGLIDGMKGSPYNFNELPKNHQRLLSAALRVENDLMPSIRFALSYLATDIWERLLDERPVEQKSLDLYAYFAVASKLESTEMILLCMEENPVVYQHFLANSLCVLIDNFGEPELISFEDALKPPHIPVKIKLSEYEPEDYPRALMYQFSKLFIEATELIQSQVSSPNFDNHNHVYITSLINLIKINSLVIENILSFKNKDESLSKLALELNNFINKNNEYCSKIEDANIPKLSIDKIEYLLNLVDEQMKSTCPISKTLQENVKTHTDDDVRTQILQGYNEACELADEYNENMLAYSSNPMANREKIKDLNQEFDLMYQECLNTLKNHIDAYNEVIDVTTSMFETFIAENAKDTTESTSHETNETSEMQIQHSKEVDEYINQINSLTSDVEALQQQLKQIKMAQKAEREHLVGKKIENIRENDSEVVPILRTIITSPQKTTLEDQLLALTALFPDVVVLPNAMASAKSSPYNNTEKSWEALLKLSNEYLPAIASGKSDCEARKVFPLNQFAANDCIASKAGAEKDKRTGEYNGKVYQFDKHLRLGYKINAEKTLRIHFDVIDKKLVIFHVGEHL